MRSRWESLLPRKPLRPDWSRLRATLRGRRVLVTGSGGSVGTDLVDALADAGVARLALVEVHEPSLFHQRQRLVRAHPELSCRFALGDVRDRRKMAALLAEEKPDVVFHLAAYKHVHMAEENVDQVVDVNVFATIGLVELAAEAGVASFLYPSTDKAVRPPSIYGATKRTAELALRTMAPGCSPMALRVVRLVNILGSQGSIIDVFAQQLAAGHELTLTDPSMTRYYITVDEAAYLLTQVACADDLPVGPFLLDAAPALSTGEFARRAAALLCPDREVTFTTIGPRPGERQHEELAYPFEQLTPTSYTGILHACDRRSPSSPEGVQARIDGLRETLREGDNAALRQALFALVQEEARWSPT